MMRPDLLAFMAGRQAETDRNVPLRLVSDHGVEVGFGHRAELGGGKDAGIGAQDVDARRMRRARPAPWLHVRRPRVTSAANAQGRAARGDDFGSRPARPPASVRDDDQHMAARAPKRRAMPRPMPLLAPVTMTLRP